MKALLLLLGTLAWQGPATETVQAPTATEAGKTAPADEDANDRRRVLLLDDGTALRGRARLMGDRWERRVGGEWVAVDGTVVSARLEKDATSEAKRRSKGVGRGAHDKRVDVARWMLAQGLHEEALHELDRVLMKDAGHAGALRLIREAPIELDLGLPAGSHPAKVLDATLKLGARGRPAEREVCVLRITDFAELVDLRALVEAELERRQPSRRAFAALLAGRLFPRELEGELLPKLARRALLDPMSDVRHSAALALRTAHSPRTVDPLASGLLSKHHEVRVRAVDALAVVAQPAAVAPLMASLAALQAGGGPPSGVRGHLFSGLQIALVTDYDVEIAQAASIGDPIVTVQQSGVMHDVRAQAQIDRRVEMRVTVAALQDLTGHAGKPPEALLEWWKTNGDAWLEIQRGTPSGRSTARR